MESLRGGTGGGRSGSGRGGSMGGSGELPIRNTSLLALLDVESLLFVFLRRGGRGGGCNWGTSESGARFTKSAVGTLDALVVTGKQVPETQVQNISIPATLIQSNILNGQTILLTNKI